MQYDFAYEITDGLMKAATRRFLLSHFRWPVLVLFLLYFALLVPFCMINHFGFLCGILTGAIFLLLLALLTAWVMRNRAAMQATRRLEHRAARCTLSEEGVRLENALATSQLTWRLIQTLVRGPDVWLLFMNRQHYFALPADRLAGAPGEFLAARVAAAGGGVR